MKFSYHKDGMQPSFREIFVFGSNLAGIHGAGAAAEAYRSYGATWGKGIGLSGISYAIPTKDKQIQTLSIESVEMAIQIFIEFAQSNPALKFFVTRIGCGLAGFKDKDIAPFFKGAPATCNFPEQWQVYLEDK